MRTWSLVVWCVVACVLGLVFGCESTNSVSATVDTSLDEQDPFASDGSQTPDVTAIPALPDDPDTPDTTEPDQDEPDMMVQVDTDEPDAPRPGADATDLEEDVDVTCECELPDQLPNARWVLHDSDAEPVSSWVEPGDDTRPPDQAWLTLGERGTTCVKVHDLEGVPFYGLRLDLESGTFEPCVSDELPPNQSFFDSECTIPIGSSSPGRLQVVKQDGQLLAAYGPPEYLGLETTYYWSVSESLCREQTTSGDFTLYKPLPDEMLGAFANPPYRVTVVY